MQFVKTEDLKVGMRLARPIYNKQGVLLFDRNSKLSQQAIFSVRNFGLIGIFVLEPAEPLPPMTREDFEFERFQTMAVFLIQEELQKIVATKKQAKSQSIVSMIIKNYGHLTKKINFIQSLRSREDYIYKHSLNVAILTTLMSHAMNIKLEEQFAAVAAAVIHDIGKMSLAPEIIDGDDSSREHKRRLRIAETNGHELIESAYPDNNQVKRICLQSLKLIEEIENGENSNMKPVVGARILAVAEVYDSMTAMKLGEAPLSEVKAIKYLLDHEQKFGEDVIKALISSINILVPGISVEFNTGEKALVLASNEKNVLKPMLLSFRDNSIIDLSDEKLYDDLEIVDVMKTLDNRYLFDTKTLKAAGFAADDMEFVE